jgi:hypothetical protein
MSNVLLNNSILANYGLYLWNPSEIVLRDKSLKIIKLIIKNAVRLIFGNFGIVGFPFFGRIPVDSSYFSLHFDSILSPKAPKYFILNVFKRSLILAGGNAGSFICRPHL